MIILKNNLKNLRFAIFKKCTSSYSSSSTIPPLFLVDYKKNYAILKLNKPSVNSLDLNMLNELNVQLDKFENDDAIHGIILTSNVPNIFSSGLDLMEMYECKVDRLRVFWYAMQELWIKLYGSNKVYIAAINGHAPAAGCLLALSCDYRIMVNGVYTIGISAAKLGIKAPFWFMDTMIQTIGHRESEKALQIGKLYKAKEALQVNLIDEVVESAESLMPQAEKQMQIWLKIPNEARIITKLSLRNKLLDKLKSQRSDDVDQFVISTNTEYVQNSLRTYLEQLKNRKN